MQAVIMAGGKGTRLSAVTKDLIPKPMADILGRPLLEWQIDVLKQYGIKEVCFIIRHLGEKIRQHFGDGSRFGISTHYIEETVPLGTAGAFYYLKDWLKEDSFLLIFGDVFFDIDLDRMIAFHCNKKAAATLFVHPNSHPFDSDLVVMDQDARIVAFDSKHNHGEDWYKNCVNAGLYMVGSEVCDRVRKPVKTDLERDLLAEMIERGENIYGYRSTEYIKDIGTVDRITDTIADIESGFVSARCLKYRQKAIFLDRDGTVNILKGLLSDIDDFVLEEDAAEAIKKINRSPWLCIIVTNQPVVARGLCSTEDVERIHRKMETLLGKEGAYIDEIMYCPHHPDKGYEGENPAFKIVCHCRKPDTGMLEQCAKKYNIDLEQSWIVGDTTVDIQTGVNARMHTALVLTGEAGRDGKYEVIPDITGDNLSEVIEQILDTN